jgi:predicted nucleic acid-binding protein
VARVFVDTNVLFPFSIMDLMLALAEDLVHEVLWSEALLAEWARVIVREQHRSAVSAAEITGVIRGYFTRGRVSEADYLGLVPDMPGEDPDDRLHMAAAIAGCAEVIVTWDRAGFPAEPLAGLGLRVADPDEYLCGLLTELTEEVTATVVRLAAEKRRPPLTPEDLVNALGKAGVPVFAERLRSCLPPIDAG